MTGKVTVHVRGLQVSKSYGHKILYRGSLTLAEAKESILMVHRGTEMHGHVAGGTEIQFGTLAGQTYSTNQTIVTPSMEYR